MFTTGTLSLCTICKSLDWAIPGQWAIPGCWLTRWSLLNVHPRVWRSHHPLLLSVAFCHLLHHLIFPETGVWQGMWYSHSVPCSLVQVTMRLLWRQIPLSNSVISGVLCPVRPAFQGPGQWCGTKGASSHPMVDPPLWAHGSCLGRSGGLIHSRCLAPPYWHFSHHPPYQKGFNCLVKSHCLFHIHG